MAEPEESLVVLSEGADSASLSGARVVHQGSARVLVVRLDGDTGLEQVRQRAGVVYAGRHPPAEIRDDLAPGELLFVEGWLLRLGEKPRRPGEGLAWDAPGMSAPDLPRPHAAQ